MQLDARRNLSIADIVVFTPSLLLAFIICVRHGFGRVSGWVYLVILCAVRVAGAACQLLIYNNPSQGLITAAMILETVGLSPLLLATLGLLLRLVDNINKDSSCRIFTPLHFRFIQLLLIIAVILGIAGAKSSTPSSTSQIPITATIKASVILCIVAWAACAFITAVSSFSLAAAPRLERQTAAAVVFALPFAGVRVVYAALAVFLDDETFALGGGDLGIFIGMAVVEEMIVVAIYLLLGFRLERVEPGEMVGAMARRRGSGRRDGRRLRYQGTYVEKRGHRAPVGRDRHGAYFVDQERGVMR